MSQIEPVSFLVALLVGGMVIWRILLQFPNKFRSKNPLWVHDIDINASIQTFLKRHDLNYDFKSLANREEMLDSPFPRASVTQWTESDFETGGLHQNGRKQQYQSPVYLIRTKEGPRVWLQVKLGFFGQDKSKFIFDKRDKALIAKVKSEFRDHLNPQKGKEV